MTAKKLLVAAALVLTAVIYYYLYADSFGTAPIQIHVNQRPRIARVRPPPGAAPAAPEEMLIFTLNQEYRLTEIRVVPLNAVLTNKYTHPLWNLVAISNAVPVTTFVYGRQVRGMQPAVKGAAAAPLTPDTGYRVVITAGSLKGQHDFKTPPAPVPDP